MTRLVFHANQGFAEIQLDDAVDIKIVGGAICAGGPVLAFHTDGAWYVGNQRLERIVCQGRVRVEFEIDTGRRSLGPFEEFSLTGDTAISTHGVVARYRPLEQTWYVDRYDSECESLIVRANATLAAA